MIDPSDLIKSPHGREPGDDDDEENEGQLVTIDEELHAVEVARAYDDLAAAGLGTSSHRRRVVPKPINGRDLMRMKLSPAPWLVRNLITRNSVGVLGAEAKSIKTWITDEIAFAVASGTPA